MRGGSGRVRIAIGVLGLACVSGLYVACHGQPSTPEANEASRRTAQPRARPAWLGEAPLIIVGNWDAMPIFQRRRQGDSPTWMLADYERQHRPETVEQLKALGVTMGLIHFYKGFGLEHEREHMEKARQLADLLHEHGIRVGVYVGSTIAYETFLLEKPEAEAWLAPDYLGEPVTYGRQVFRRRPYFMHPQFIDYMKEVVRIAVEDFDVDLVHFDNTSIRAARPIFHHPMAVSDFRAYLQRRYSAEERKQRFGLSDVSRVVPPKWERWLEQIDDPIFQEWTNFRCQQLANFYGMMAEYISTLDPEVAVENNPSSGLSGGNTMWDQGVDYPRLLAHTDIVWTEEGNEATVTDDGVLVSKIRSYKQATTLGNSVFTYTSEHPLQMAEAMAYNRQSLGMVGGMFAGEELPPVQRRYIDFYQKHFASAYQHVDNVADVAVLRDYSTMAYNNGRPYQSVFLFEQALIQARVPFDIIFNEGLRDLSSYKVLVLADQQALNDEELERIREHVSGGGGLVATEHATLYDDPLRRRPEFGLQDLFGVKAPPWGGWGSQDALLDVEPVRNELGDGRVVYLAEVIPAVPRPPTERMTSEYWHLPENWRELIESVRWAADGSLSVEITAPDTVTMELLDQRPAGNRILHLLNYNVDREAEVRDIHVRLTVPDARQVSTVRLLTPDGDGEEMELPYERDEDAIAFNVPSLQVYDLVIVELQ